MTILGTRPEIIRLSCVINILEKTEGADHVLVHTGQNYDYELHQVIFENLNLRQPDHFLSAAGETFGKTYGQILEKSEVVMREEKPDAVLILGGTNSALSALIAKRLHIPIFHMEAGNSCFDFNVPEEMNRRIVVHVADFNLVYTEHARRHRLSEGLDHHRIYLTGSPMREVLNAHLEDLDASMVLENLDLETQESFIVSAHREENVDNPDALAGIEEALNMLVAKYSFPVISSTHSCTRKRLEGNSKLTLDPKVQLLNPLGFFDYNHFQKNAFCFFSDSGTIAEESSMLGFPAITMRNSIERPEALDTGSIAVTGHEGGQIVALVDFATKASASGQRSTAPADYCITDTSLRVVNLILSLSKLSDKWAGIASKS